MKIKWVANVTDKKRNRLTNNHIRQTIAWDFHDILKELDKINSHALVEIEKVEILRKSDSDLLVDIDKDLTIKEVG
jgi:hypothetical protein